jgi:uncharacterized cofD-like protein
MSDNIKIVTIGGGSGQFVLLSGLRDIADIDITAVVSMVDSGGSTGRLRDEFGILPPGDILKCTLALSADRDYARKILQKRFNNLGRLNGHVLGNLVLTILSQYSGSFPDGVQALGEALDIRGRVLPVTTDKATLVAELNDGSRLYGETTIDVPKGLRGKIKKTFLVPHHSEEIKVYPPVLEAILEADYIVIGPGDLYTSITPNFLVPGVKESIIETKARLIHPVNIMTKFGETDNFSVRDFVEHLENTINRALDFVIVNSSSPDRKVLQRYEQQKAFLITYNDKIEREGRRVIVEDMLSTAGDFARHDSEKLAVLINKIIKG